MLVAEFVTLNEEHHAICPYKGVSSGAERPQGKQQTSQAGVKSLGNHKPASDS